MTDRPALAEAIVRALQQDWHNSVEDDVTTVARVLAEHETAIAVDDSLRQQLERIANEHVQPHDARWIRGASSAIYGLRIRAEAAEARCAQLEQERDFQRARAEDWLAVVKKHDQKIEQLAATTAPTESAQLAGHLLTPEMNRHRFAHDLIVSDATVRSLISQAARLAQLEAEHERLRAALEAWVTWRDGPEGPDVLFSQGAKALELTRTALAPSQEPVK